MMNKQIIFVLMLIGALASGKAQTSHSSLLSGDWNTLLTWTPVTSTPSTLDPVTINFLNTITLVQNETCASLSVSGTLDIDTAQLTITGDLNLDGGTINLNDGTLVVQGDITMDGTINSATAGSYLKAEGDIDGGGFGSNALQVLDGAVIIYGGLEFPQPNFSVE